MKMSSFGDDWELGESEVCSAPAITEAKLGPNIQLAHPSRAAVPIKP
jgi:hypothetical protein